MQVTLAKELGATGLDVYSDSLLIVSQIKGEFTAKDSKMTAYLDLAKQKTKLFDPFSITQIPRDQNTQADALANLGSALRKLNFKNIPIAHVTHPAISKPDETEITSLTISTSQTNSWKEPYLNYLQNGTLPADKLEARKIK